MQALIAMALLYAGGLKTIQMASIAAGLPIAVFILIMSVALMRCVRLEGFTGLHGRWPKPRRPSLRPIPQKTRAWPSP
ncbi:BCCT family transporter [Pseudomonas sp. YJ42]|uniref:BCCT family transporter n=1 Tax=Pseudomonas sp. YJ42 TaxID=3392115 RepID=UPI0039A2FFB9